MKNRILKKIFCAGLLICIGGLAFACGKDELTQQPNTEVGDNEGKQQDEAQYTYPLLVEFEDVENIRVCVESEDIIMISEWENWKYYNKSGDRIGDDSYEKAYPFTKEGMAVVYKDGKYGFIDRNGEPIGGFVYDDLAPYSEELAYFVKGDEYGFLNIDGSVAFYLDCDSVSSFSEGMAYYCIDGKYGYINANGESVITAEYSDADYFQNGVAFVTIDGYKGAINQKGEVVIPIQYGVIVRENGYIYAKEGDRYDYFDLNGKTISEEESQKLEEAYYNSQSCEFTTAWNDNTFVVLNSEGAEVLTTTVEQLALAEMYGDDVNFVIDSKKIVFLTDAIEKDLSGILLKNSITPRKRPYYEMVREKDDVIYAASELLVTKVKYYDIDNSGEPILYYHIGSKAFRTFPLSESAFFIMDGDEVITLLEGSECGGSLRGDYICFWKHVDTGEVVLGIDGAAGGFGGFAVYSSTYEYKDKAVTEMLNFHLIEQTARNYDEEELQADAHLFLNEDGNPHTKDSIAEAYSEGQYVTEFILNDIRVSSEEYENAATYKYFSLY